MRITICIILVAAAIALKLAPLQVFTDSNFQQITGFTPNEFASNPKSIPVKYFLLFVIPGCIHCKDAKKQFENFRNQYEITKFENTNEDGTNKQISDEQKMEEGINFAIINCAESDNLCRQFAIQKYPTIYFIDRSIWEYTASRYTNELLVFLRKRLRGDWKVDCEFIGEISTIFKIKRILQPITDLFHQQTLIFVLVFAIAPFLYGFLFMKQKPKKE